LPDENDTLRWHECCSFDPKCGKQVWLVNCEADSPEQEKNTASMNALRRRDEEASKCHWAASSTANHTAETATASAPKLEIAQGHPGANR